MWDWGVLPAFQKTLWGKPVTNVINLQFQSQSPKTIFYLVHTKFLSFKYQMFYKNSTQNSWSFKNYSIRSVLTSLGCFLMTRYSSKFFYFPLIAKLYSIDTLSLLPPSPSFESSSLSTSCLLSVGHSSLSRLIHVVVRKCFILK